MTDYYYTLNDEPILSVEEQKIIVDWTRKHFIYFKPNNGNKYMQKMSYFENLPQCIWDIKKRIFDKENAHDYEQEPIFQDSIGIMFKGESLHLHSDPNPPNRDLIHTRFNVYVQLPEKGGYPIYNNIHCTLKERTYICCRSGIDKHCCARVEGDRERIILSFGILVPLERIKNIHYNYSSTETIGTTTLNPALPRTDDCEVVS